MSTKSRRAAGRAARCWELRVYVANEGTRSTLTIANLERLCEQSVPGRYWIQVVNLLKRPELASADQIVAVPTIVRRSPLPERRVIGTLSDSEAAMTALELNS